MDDLEDLVRDHIYGPTRTAAANIDENPEEGAQAIKLAGLSGIPPSAVYNDLPAVKTATKANMAGEIIRNSPEIQEYIRSHPLASVVSNDDYGNLAKFSQGAAQTVAMKKLVSDRQADWERISKDPESFGGGWADLDTRLLGGTAIGAAQGAYEGAVGGATGVPDITGDYIKSVVGEPAWLRPVIGLNIAAAGGLEAALRTGGALFGAGAGAITGAVSGAFGQVSPEAGKIAQKEVSGMLEEYMGRIGGSGSVVKPHPAFEVWLKNGEIPPIGVMAEFDKLRADANAKIVERIAEDTKNIQSSATHERSPEMSEKFVEQQFGNDTIAISGPKVAEAYKDLIPDPNDGFLGWVPGIEEKLEAARENGEDVHIPLKDWLTKVDPAIATELQDHIRAFKGGITKQEAVELAERGPPPEVVDAALPAVRAAADVEPHFSMGDRKLTLVKDDSEEPMMIGPSYHNYQMLDEYGKSVGELTFVPDPATKTLHIQMIGGRAGLWSNSFGPALIRDLKRQLKTLYPDYDTITGHRVTGARAEAESTDATAAYPKVRLDVEAPSGWGTIEGYDEFKALRSILDQTYLQKYGNDITGYIASPEVLEKIGYGPLTNLLSEEANRIFGRAATFQSPIQIKYKGNEVGGVALHRNPDELRHVIVNLMNTNPQGLVRHEAIHVLKNYFKPEEWAALEKVARDENWIGRYDVNDRWGHLGLSESAKLEEAIAEGYREWSNNPENVKAATTPVTGIFAKIKDFIDRVLARIGEMLGRKVTAEEVFGRVESGEVNQRAEGEASTSVPKFSMEESDGFRRNLQAQSLGLNKKTFDNLMRMSEDQYKSDIEAETKRALAIQKKRQSAEWKANRQKELEEVTTKVHQIPEVQADLYVGAGFEDGVKKRQRFPLRASDLTAEQKATLPRMYYSVDGVPIDYLANKLGYQSGDQMVAALGAYQKAKGDLSPQEYVRKIAADEADRVMEEKHGNLGDNVLTAARDQAFSDAAGNRLTEEYLATGMQAGVETISKDVLKEKVRNRFENEKLIGQIDAREYDAQAAKYSREAERNVINGKPREAVENMQHRTYFGLAAIEARKLEKKLAQFDRVTEPYSKTFDPQKLTIPADWNLALRDILYKVQRPNGLTQGYLEHEFGAQGYNGLADFVKKKEAEYANAGLELPIPDFLMEPDPKTGRAFSKPIDQMTPAEFDAVFTAIKALRAQGRSENKVVRAGKAMERKEWIEKANDQLRNYFPPIERNETPAFGDKAKEGFNRFAAVSTNNETLMSRFDHRDPHGIFTQTISLPAAHAANHKFTLESEFGALYKDLGEIKNANKTIASPFLHPETKEPLKNFTRQNLHAVIANMGNEYNWNVLAKGWGLKPEALWKWVEKNSTVEDIERGQKLGKIFNRAKELNDQVWRNLYGAAPPNIEVRPFTMHGKEFEGWYHPIIGDRDFGKHENQLDTEGKQSWWPSVASPFMKRRTGAIDRLSLNLDAVPAKLNLMLHNVAFKEFVYNTSKIFNDPSFKRTVTARYGGEYLEEMNKWLERVAGNASTNSGTLAYFNRLSSTARSNVIATQIGFNPYTVEKHGATAFMMSARELGPNLFKTLPQFLNETRKTLPGQVMYALPEGFRRSVLEMFGKDPEMGDSTFKWVLDNFEEVKRREKNYIETTQGQQENVFTGNTPPKWVDSVGLGGMYRKGGIYRDWVMRKGAAAVAFSDMMSAAPLAHAVYWREMAESGDHGLAIQMGNMAVRRAHGSTAITNLPRIATGDNPFTPWMTSLYGFMGTNMQRRIEILHDLNDAGKLGMKGDINGAAKLVPGILSGIGVYVLWTGIVEETVSHQSVDDKRSEFQQLLTATMTMVSNSVIGLRDLTHDLETGSEATGLLSTPIHDANNLLRDLEKKNMFARQNAGKFVQDAITVIGDFSGMAPKHVGAVVRHGMDLFNNVQRDKEWEQTIRGFSSGTNVKHVVR